MNPEPLEACPCGDPSCRCGRCHGVAWVQVSPEYVRRHFPDHAPDLLDPLPPEAAEYLQRQLELNRRAAANSYYPCRACAPDLFFRWRDGHLADDHDRARCPDCQGKGVAPRRRGVA